MKANNKILKLVEHGLKSSTLAELNPKQIDALYSRLMESKKETKEEVKQQVTNTTFDPTQSGDQQKLAQKGIHIDPTTKKITMTTTSSGAITEVDEDLEDLAIGMESNGKLSPDEAMAMSMTEKFESKSQQKLFFAKCGDGKTKEQKKWCKMAKEFADSTKNFKKLPEKKKETKEEFGFGDYNKKISSINTGNLKDKMSKTFNPTFEQKLQESIEQMVQKHIRPKISKKDFINTISEAEKEVETPVKPDVDTPSRPKPSTPYQPKHKPAPKAGEKEIQTPVKPDVKPERPRPATPYQPKHQPAPKAGDLPDWLNFNNIGINLK